MDESISARARAALTSKAPESSALDYKMSVYDKTEGGRKEFAKDVAGLANRAGGMLIIGVREKAGTPVDLPGVDDSSLDAEILWLESVARSWIAPHHPISIQPLTMDNTSLIVVDVPSGFDKPYEVPQAGARFFVRDERSVRPMSREELKFAILRTADLPERIRNFCDHRWQTFSGPNHTGRTDLDRTQGGSQLIVFPVFEQSFSFRFDLPAIFHRHPHRTTFSLRDVASARPFLEGIEYKLAAQAGGKFHSALRVYRHGAIEYADGYVMDIRSVDGQPGKEYPHPGTLLMRALLGSIRNAILLSEEITGASAFVVDFRMRSKVGHPISFFRNDYGSSERMVSDRSELVFDPVTVLPNAAWEEELPSICRPLLDQIWQAFGFTNCGYFNEAGAYEPPQ